MALKFNENIAYTGKQPNFERDSFPTIEKMRIYSENYLPNIFIATCEEDGGVYVFNKSNEIDPVLGKWRPLGGSEGKIKSEIIAAYNVGGVKEGDKVISGTEFEALFKKILEGERKEGVVSYYGVAAEKVTNLAGLTKVEEVPNFSFTIDASNEYVIIACPNSIDNVTIFSNGFDYTTSFTKFVSSTYTFYYSEVKVTCSNFTYTVNYN